MSNKQEEDELNDSTTFIIDEVINKTELNYAENPSECNYKS